MNVQETHTGVAQLLRHLPFRELVTFADAMRACADRGADALTCAEAIDAWARGDTDQVDQKYEDDDTSAADDAADTSSGVISASEGPGAGLPVQVGNALHARLPPQTSPAGGDASVGASSEQDQVRQPADAEARSPDAAGEGPDSRQHPEHQDDGGPGTGCQP